MFCSDVVRVVFGKPSVKPPFYRTRSEGDPNRIRRKTKKIDLVIRSEITMGG